jgi:hypothetical protein
MDFAPAPIPTRARVLGGLAIALLLPGLAAVGRDLAIGKLPLGSGAFVATLGFALGWVAADMPILYRLEGREIVILTRVRSVRRRWSGAAPLREPWRDRFAINGGFGWYGWFRVGRKTLRAWVTDADKRVVVTTDGMPVVISPDDPEGFVKAARRAPPGG